MHFQFLLEDQSTEVLINKIMPKVLADSPETTYRCKSFRGLGGFTKKNTVKETRTGKLLNDLTTYIKGFNKSLQNYSAAIVVVLDLDDHDRNEFSNELYSVLDINHITVDCVFCFAIEEIEAWLLGDGEALHKAYPKAKLHILHTYDQDSVCGTWEILAECIYPGGLKQLNKDCTSYREVGQLKARWADSIGTYMDLGTNNSPSFKSFLSELYKRINPAA